MKVAISAVQPQFEGELERRFGRCAYFVVVDAETLEWESIPNPAVEARGGAGTQAAQFLANQGVQAVISGDFGPNAYAALETAGISMYKAQGERVNEALEALLAEHLERVTSAT
ncbi:MAG: dinitrogenase iron-molybdenum cofactor biosynthesis protein, partial [Anaerolineales bacterium]